MPIHTVHAQLLSLTNTLTTEWTRVYERALQTSVAFVPLVAILYIETLGDPIGDLVFHSMHESFTFLVLAISIVTAWLAWNCLCSSGEVFLRWVTLGFLSFAILYLGHGISTRTSHNHMDLFLLFGPVARIAMMGCLTRGLFDLGKGKAILNHRRNLRFLSYGGIGILLLNALTISVALSFGTSIQGLHIALEWGALLMALIGAAVIQLTKIRGPLMPVYQTSLLYMAQASISFLLGPVWSQQWWLAHLISFAGFLMLSYGVVRAFHTTKAFAEMRSQEEMIQKIHQITHQAEQSLMELRLASNVLCNTTDGVVVSDLDGIIVAINPAFSEVTGYSAHDLLGKNYQALLSAHPDRASQVAIHDLLARDRGWRGDIWIQTRSGDSRLINLNIQLIGAEFGRPARYVGIFNDITEKQRNDEHIRFLAYHDPLTRLPNRFLLLDRLEHAIAIASRDKLRLALIYIDLDRFKGINDSFGHDIGDKLLQQMASRFSEGLRISDTIARMGGDEFLVLMENLQSLEDCTVFARKILAITNEPITVTGQELRVAGSVGIAIYPEDGPDAVTLIKHADTAMYAAKQQGGDRFLYFLPSMTQRALRRQNLEMDLRKALQFEELELHFQPQVQLADLSLHSVEVLLRWRHPDWGFIEPSEFVQVAEESGLMPTIGDWVIQKVCRHLASWSSSGLRLPKTAINVSATQLQQPEFAQKLDQSLSQYRIPSSTIEIELTESGTMGNPEQAKAICRQLRDIGVSVALDDFGTGYSSLACLHNLPLDVLKIDKSFVVNACVGNEAAQIVKTIMTLGRVLNLTVVAEGVETEQQADLLTAYGCTIGQGFLFARPLEPDTFARQWLTPTIG